MGKLHWQNVVAPPQNETQQSNGKARAQMQNTAVQKRCDGGLAERCSAAAERKHNNQMGKRGTGRTLSTINKYSF
jgi:hypothetical protein